MRAQRGLNPKDLLRGCEQCGLDPSSIQPDLIGAKLRANVVDWRELLGRAELAIERPEPKRWSALEYGCHVRDLYQLFGGRIVEMLKVEAPVFSDWNQEQVAVDNDYRSANPDTVAYELAVNAGLFADIVDRVRPNQWDRTGIRSDGVEFNVQSKALYMYHEAYHHSWDARSGIDSIVEAKADDEYEL